MPKHNENVALESIEIGNSFFNVLIDQIQQYKKNYPNKELGIPDTTASNWRMLLAQHFLENKQDYQESFLEQYEQTVTEHVIDFQKNGFFVDRLHVQALSKWQNLNLIILVENNLLVFKARQENRPILYFELKFVIENFYYLTTDISKPFASKGFLKPLELNKLINNTQLGTIGIYNLDQPKNSYCAEPFESKEDFNLLIAMANSALENTILPQKMHELRQVTLEYGLDFFDIPENRDGNCFFHAIVDQITQYNKQQKNPKLHLEIRNHLQWRSLLADYMSSKGDANNIIFPIYKKSLQSHLVDLRAPKFFVDAPHIAAFAKMLKITLVIFNQKDPKDITIIKGDDKADGPVFYLGHERGEPAPHYQSLSLVNPMTVAQQVQFDKLQAKIRAVENVQESKLDAPIKEDKSESLEVPPRQHQITIQDSLIHPTGTCSPPLGIRKNENNYSEEKLSIPQSAREQGDFYLSQYFEFAGDPVCLKKAINFYTIAAEQGDLNAQLCLGERYAEGIGVAKNLVLAERYYGMAQKQGDSKAKLFMDHYKKFGFFHADARKAKLVDSLIFDMLDDPNDFLDLS